MFLYGEGIAPRSAHVVANSRGSLEELRYLILLSQELGFIGADTHEDLEQKATEISKMLNSLINKLEALK